MGRGYGLNKVSHLYRMAVGRHFEFIVNTANFVTAPEHEPSKDYSKTYGQSCDPLQSARIQALFNIAVEEMDREGEEMSNALATQATPSQAECEVFVAQYLAQIMTFILYVAYYATLLTYFPPATYVNKIWTDVVGKGKVEIVDTEDELNSVIIPNWDKSETQLKTRRRRTQNRRGARRQNSARR